MESPRPSVKVVEICRISPPPNRQDSAAPKTLPFTFFDLLWLRFPPVQRLFFYQTQTDSFYDSIIPKLKHSLSLSLLHYLPLAGHLVWPEKSLKPVIEYTDCDGVSFTVVESNGMDFDGLSGRGFFRGAEEWHPLIPKLGSSSEQAEVISLQVTLFPGSGFCLGIASHHAVLDGKTSTSFVKSWAEICRSLGESNESFSPEVLRLKPFYDRMVIGDPSGLESIYANAWLNEDGVKDNRSLKTWEMNVQPGLVRGTFELSREKIEKLKNSAATKRNPAVLNPLRISTYLSVSSYVSVCLAKAIRVSRGADRIAPTMYLSLLADFRTRLNPIVPAEYFGNCVGGRGTPVETEALSRENGMSTALEAVGKAVKSLEDKDVLKGAENLVSMMIAGRAKLSRPSNECDANRDSIRVISFVGSPRFEVYSADFGFGRPKKVEMASIDKTGAICLSDGKNGDGGVEIGLVVKLNEMEAFASEFVKGLEML